MNKLFTKIVGAALGLTMAIGLGVAVASNSEASKVDAATEYESLYTCDFTSVSAHSYTMNKTFTLNEKGWTSSISQVNGGVFYLGCNSNNSSKGVLAGTQSGNPNNAGFWDDVVSAWSAADSKYSTSVHAYALMFDNSYSNVAKVNFSWSGGNNAFQVFVFGDSGSGFAKIASTNYATSGTSTSGSAEWSGTATNYTRFAIVARPGTTSTTATNKTLRASTFTIYKEKAASKTLSSIVLNTDNVTKNFLVGDPFSYSGLVVTAKYTDSTTYPDTQVTPTSVSNPDMSTAGNKTVTVTYAEGGVTKTADYSITVSAPTTPYIAPAKNSISGYTGQNESLSFTYGYLTGSLSVTSSSTSVVTVGTPSYSAGSGTVQFNFVGAGSTTVKFYDGSTELASVSVSVTTSSVTITGLAASGSVYIGKTLNLGSTVNVTATGIYSNAVRWESDDASIATVNLSTGVVTGVSEGTAHISVTSVDYPSAKMSCTVTVSEEPLQYVMTFGATKDTNPTEIKKDADYHSTYSSVDSDIVADDFSKIYGVSTSQLKCGSKSATAKISFTIPSTSYITSVEVVVAAAGGTSLNVTSSAEGASTENQNIAVGTLTFDDYLASEKSNKVTLASTASGAFYLSSITINYANFTPELHASSTSVEAAVNTSDQSINLTYDYFTPTSYTATVKSGTSLTADAVAFSTSSTPHTATFTTGSSTGATVFTITGTGGGKSASVDVTVTVTEVRNLLTLTITTPSDATSFKVGQSFDVGSLEITATFDAAPTTVVYSKANDNLGALTFAPAIGYTFVDADIGTVTSVMAELELGTGDEYVEYTIAVTDKTYAAQVTSVSDLWDGQQIYFGASDGSRVNVVHAGGNQLTSQEANVHETKGLCLDDLEHSAAYTVHREKIDGVIYYSFQNGGYYLEASNTSNNYLTRTDTLSDNCRYTISISSGEVTMTNKGNSSRPEFRWNSGSSWFSQYQSSSSLDKAVIYAITSYSEEAVADAFVEQYLHMDESVSGQCNTYYPILKPVWAAMGEFEKAALSGAPYERLQAWAAAHGEHLDSDMNIVANARINILGNVVQNGNTVAIIVVISMISVTAIGGYFFLRKRKED